MKINIKKHFFICTPSFFWMFDLITLILSASQIKAQCMTDDVRNYAMHIIFINLYHWRSQRGLEGSTTNPLNLQNFLIVCLQNILSHLCTYTCRAVGTSCCLPIGWQQLGVAFPPGCYTSRERSRVVVGGCLVRV